MNINHKKHLLRLLKGILDAKLENELQQQLYWHYLTNWIPEPEVEKIFNEAGIVFKGDEKANIHNSCFELRKDLKTEYLENRELNERLSALAVEVIENRDKYLKPNVLDEKIVEFLNEILKPLVQYEILFKIHNMNVEIDELQFWDAKIARLNADALVEWGFDPEGRNIFGADFFADKNVIIVEEIGNNSSEVEARARIKASRRLRALQTYLKEEYMPIHDFQLHFSPSDEYALRKKEKGQRVGTGFKSSSATPYDYKDSLIKQSEAANAHYKLIKTLPQPLVDLFERSLYWIGLAVSEADLDIKIAYLCTSLETLLTTKQDGRKGETIAYRGYLLAMEANSEQDDIPQSILRAYEIRSSVVHGSKLGIASKNDYLRLLILSKATYANLIEFATSNKLTKQSKIYDELMNSEHLTPLINWLDEFGDKTSTAISESIKEDLSK